MGFKIYMFTDLFTLKDKTIIAKNENESYEIVQSQKQKSEPPNINWVYN